MVYAQQFEFGFMEDMKLYDVWLNEVADEKQEVWMVGQGYWQTSARDPVDALTRCLLCGGVEGRGVAEIAEADGFGDCRYVATMRFEVRGDLVIVMEDLS